MFDISSPEALFRVIRRNANTLRGQTAKESDRLLFVIFGLNHLREWIAPGYSNRPLPRSPTNDNERFFESIWSCTSFQLIKELCNHTKHLRPIGLERTGYGLNISDWPDIGSVESFAAGPPTSYEIDGKDVLEAVEEVIEFYKRRWFDRHRTQPV
ncbi:MAG: hypothetical protein IPM60_11660 [Rhodospirillales bacterium]|nr:hypothetical protein [Rhodospirillales bacterium]